MIEALMAKTVKPPGPVLGMRRAMRTEGNPPGGGPSCTTGMSLTDCVEENSVWSMQGAVDAARYPGLGAKKPGEGVGGGGRRGVMQRLQSRRRHHIRQWGEGLHKQACRVVLHLHAGVAPA